MSKLIYILDKIVWMLLITVITSQSLQIAGVVEAPKGLGQISYPETNEYDYQLAIVNNNDAREKRHANDRSPFIDSLFNIPISTLNALNNLVQHSRPAFKKLKDYAMKKLDKSGEEVQENTASHTAQKRGIFPVFSFKTKDDGKENKTFKN